MRVKVTNIFRDCNDLRLIRLPGEVLEVSAERGERIISLGLGERLDPQPTGVEVKDEPSGEGPATPAETVSSEETAQGTKPKRTSRKSK